MSVFSGVQGWLTREMAARVARSFRPLLRGVPASTGGVRLCYFDSMKLRIRVLLAGALAMCSLIRADDPAANAAPLRVLAEGHGMNIGAAVSRRGLGEDERYARVLAREFNMVTAESAMKFGPLVRERGRYDFQEADRLMDFATRHGMKLRGHTFVWHRQTPAWLKEDELSPDEIKEILRRHIFTVAGRYRGRVAAWDVVNEAVDEDGSLRDSIWLRALGPDYIAAAFRWAHEADPAARLYYNDYGGEALNVKSDGIYRLVKQLRKEGVPIHGVGLQMHLVLGSSPSPKAIASNMERLGALGLEVAVTEMDVRIPEPVTEEKLVEQAEVYASILRVALAAGNCRDFVLWGFTDGYSWIPRWFPGTDAGLIFDADCLAKPAYEALRNVLKNEPLSHRQ